MRWESAGITTETHRWRHLRCGGQAREHVHGLVAAPRVPVAQALNDRR